MKISTIEAFLAYMSRVWTPEVRDDFQIISTSTPTDLFLKMCRHFIRYEGSMTMIGIHIVALMMLLRIHALYYERKWVVVCLAFLFIVMASMNAWLLTHGERQFRFGLLHPVY
jgi:hypothetical protein